MTAEREAYEEAERWAPKGATPKLHDFVPPDPDDALRAQRREEQRLMRMQAIYLAFRRRTAGGRPAATCLGFGLLVSSRGER